MLDIKYYEFYLQTKKEKKTKNPWVFEKNGN